MTSGGRWWGQPLAVSVTAALLAVPAVLPLLGGSYLQAHDGFAHLFRLYVLDSAIRQGVWYPRWSPELVFGLGYPIFTFYNPLVSYLAEALHLAGLTFTDSLRALVGLAALFGAAGMAWWLRPHFGVAGALVGAVAYTYAPYALVNVYVRGAFGEVVAAALFPWALGLADRAFSDQHGVRWWRAVGAGLVVGLIILAHNPSALVFAGMLLVYVVVTSPALRGNNVRIRAGGLAVVAGVAFGVTAWFWLPFFAHLRDTWIGSFPTGVEDFYRALANPGQLVQQSLVFDYDRFWDSEQKAPLVPTVVALVGAVALRWASPAARRLGLAALVVAVALLFLMTAMAEPIWRLLPLASLMSFPWRLLGGLALAVAVLAAVAPAAAGRWSFAAAIPLAAALIGASLPSLQPNPLDVPDAQVNRATATRLDVDGALTGTTSPAQFVPRWVVAPVQQYAAPAEWADLSPAARVTDASAIRFDGWQYELRLRVAEAGPLRLRVFYFPGWEATLNGQPVPVRPDGPMGELTLDLPVGDHEVRAWYGRTWAHRLGDAVSVVTVLGLVGVAALRAPSLRLRLATRAGVVGLTLIAFALAATRPADAMQPTTAMLAPELRLLGYRSDFSDVSRRGAARIELLWLATTQPANNYRVVIQLLNDAGQLVATNDRPPQYGAAPTSRWRAATVVPDSHDVMLPPGLAAGTYRLAVGLRREGEAPSMTIVGTISTPPTPRERFATPTSAPVAVFGAQIALNVEPELSPLVVAPGETARVWVTWQALSPIDIDYSVFVQAMDHRFRSIGQVDSYPGLDLRFMTAWEPGRPVRDRYDVPIAPNAPAGRYWLGVGVYDRATGERLPAARGGEPLDSRVVIRPLIVTPRAVPAPTTRVVAEWPGVGALMGYDAPADPTDSRRDCAPVVSGCDTAVILHWRPSGPTDRPLVSFLHVRDATGRVVAQHDAEPRDGLWPTDFWLAGQTVLDPRPLPGWANLPAGDYTLVVGWYRRDTGARLPMADGATEMVVGRLRR